MDVERGAQFTCFTSTKVQILTQKALLKAYVKARGLGIAGVGLDNFEFKHVADFRHLRPSVSFPPAPRPFPSIVLSLSLFKCVCVCVCLRGTQAHIHTNECILSLFLT